MKIGIDLDGVCFDFARSLHKYLVMRGVLPDAVDMPLPTRWEFYEDWGLSLEEFIGHCYEGSKAGVVFKYGAPINDAVNQLQRLRDAGHKIVIVTDRDFGEAARENTRQWLAAENMPHDDLIFTAKKGEVDIDYLIDDRAENYDEARKAGIRAYLLARPWNENSPTMFRIGSLAEFVDVVLMATLPPYDKRRSPFWCNKCNDSTDSPVHAYACERSHIPTPKTADEVFNEGVIIREFGTGATRDSDNGKLDFEGFLDPAVEWAFAEYMSANRHMKDGSLRASDNWQSGMPLDVYMKSLLRHVWDLWMIHRGHKPIRPENGEEVTVDSALGGIKFNTNGYWRETLKARDEK